MSRELWQAVLAQAVEDALNGVPVGLNKSLPVREGIIRQTRRLLTTPNDDLEIICAFAGFDPQAVIDRMAAQLANAPSVEELATSPRVAKTVLRNDRGIRRRRLSLAE